MESGVGGKYSCYVNSFIILFVCYFLMHCESRQDANRQLQRFVASILSLLQELNRCRDSPFDRENAEFLLLRLGGAMRHINQVITFVETSPEFSHNDVNNLRQLSPYERSLRASLGQRSKTPGRQLRRG